MAAKNGPAFQSATRQQPLNLVRTINLPRVEGRIDHLAIDLAGDRLFVAALGNNTVEVIDLLKNAVVKSVPGFHEPQGILVVPAVGRVAVADGQTGNVQWLDTNSYRVTGTTPLGTDADNIRYEAHAKRVYVGYGSGAIAAIDAADGELLGEVTLAGHPESFQIERLGSRIFVNVPAAGQIAVIDRNVMKVIASWPVVSARSNFPMALDEANHRLFVGCRTPARVLVYDTTNGKDIGSLDIVGDTDDLFYDDVDKRLYVSGGEGFLDVFQQQNGSRLGRVAHLATAAGARTSLFVPEENRLYLAVPHRGAQTSEIRVYEPH